MTRDFWNSQMQFSVIIENFADLLEQAERESADWAGGRDFTRISYGDHARQWFEITEGNGGTGVLPVIIHGGYWRALAAEPHRFLMESLLPFGRTVANVEYRLMPEVRLGDVVDDVSTALQMLAERFPGEQLLVVGHSAGAHLAVSALDTPALAGRIAGVIALSGAYDLKPVPLSFLQDEISLTAEEVAKHSVYPRDDRPPVLYVNGADETHEFIRGSYLMASEGPSAVRILPDANHMTLLWAAKAEMSRLVEDVLELDESKTE